MITLKYIAKYIISSIAFIGCFIGAVPFTFGQSDSLKTFTLKQLFEWTMAYHPIVKQAELLPEFARREVQIVRGAFDPTLDLHWNRKDLWNYKENWAPATYFENWRNYLKTPIWIGDIKWGFERYTGINVNPENFTPPYGLIFMEIGIPLAQDLVIDERRAVLQKSHLLAGLNDAEKIKIINKILFQCAKDYWYWYETYNKLTIAERGYRIANERYQFVKQTVQLGDLAPVDTIEAQLEVLKRSLTLQEAKVDFNNARLILSNHLWDEARQPLELASDAVPYVYNIRPKKFSPNALDSLSQFAQSAHPDVRKLSLKIEQLEIDRRLAKNNLLPRVDFDYKPFWIPKYGEVSTRYWQENYKVGVNFYMPLFLRKDRGKLESVKLKIQDSQLELTSRKRNLTNEVATAVNNLNNFVQQIEVQQLALTLADKLLKAEVQKFDNGESSLFLINSRERSLLSERQKLIELQVKYMKAGIEVYWTAGSLLSNLD